MFSTCDCIENIQVSSKEGFLYIFDAKYYDRKNSLILDNTIKIGMTRGCIKKRLLQYTFPPKNILYINCSIPSKRESILKYYIKTLMNIKPSYGTEYFNYENKTNIEYSLLYFALCDVEIINEIYNLYRTEKAIKQFYYISDLLNPHIDKILKDDIVSKKELDFSQKRIDYIVETTFTYDVYKNQKIMDEVIMKFFLNEEGVNIATLMNKKHMILKILEKNEGEYIYIDPEDIQKMCQNSKPMMKRLKEYEAKIIEEFYQK